MYLPTNNIFISRTFLTVRNFIIEKNYAFIYETFRKKNNML